MGSHLQFSLRALALSGLLAALAAANQGVSVSGNGLAATVSPNGSYEIVFAGPQWRFAGNIGASLSNLSSESGADAMGAFSEISFDFRTNAQRHAAIRTYSASGSILFTVVVPAGGPNTFSFPDFTAYPQGLSHIAYDGTFAYPTFTGWCDESPWIAFDSTMNTAILSPASHFMVARTNTLPAGDLVSGISPKIAALPAGFTHQTILTVSTGINRAFDVWGNLLTGITGKVRPANDADVTLRQIGYWTDAGSSYYYSTAPGLTYPETLSAVKADFARVGISLGSLQLDSWFYPKGPSADWKAMESGIYEYFAADPPFASSLAAFQSSLAVPLVTHARWIDPSSPYWQQYQMSGTVSIDPLYWSYAAGYLAGSGAAGFEQDWLADKATTAYDLTDGDAFLDNMAAAMERQEIAVQYCSATARHFLQSAKYNNVTTIRASMDRFNSARWTSFLYASRLASAVGTWPFTDVFMSGEKDNLLVATLSAGPLGVGDPVGSLNAQNLLQAVRTDGAIVKPDVPLTPLDSSFWNDSQNAQAPMIAATHSDFGNLRAWYFFLYPQSTNTQAQFRLSDAGVSGPVYLYDYFGGAGRVVHSGDWLDETVESYRYLIAAPIGISGIALIGDTGHFVTLGKKRVTALADDGILHVTLAFATGESSRTLSGYSPVPPEATAVAGTAGTLSYNSASGRFEVTVQPGPDGVASLEIARAPHSLRRRP